MVVHRQQAEGVSIRWLSLDSGDVIHPGSHIVGVKFYYYTGSGDPTLNSVRQLGTEIWSAAIQQDIFTFTPYCDVNAAARLIDLTACMYVPAPAGLLEQQ